MTVIHGGNVYELASAIGCSPDDILDYSASINPLGPPPGLSELLTRHFHWLQHYPDIKNHQLIESLAELHGIDPECISVGNGSTELIYWLPKALGIRKALAVLPTFGEYAKAFELQGVELEKIFASSDNLFLPTVSQLESALRDLSPQAVLLTHPGSPGGALHDRSFRRWVVEKSRKENILFIVDEVFIDFCEEESFKEFLNDSPNLVIIRSLTKFYGLPGLRIGYLISPHNFTAKVRNVIPPWSVNTLAQIAGVYCLKQEEYRAKTLDLVGSERERLVRELKNVPGFHVFPGEANYLLIRLDVPLPAARLKQDIFDSERIVIRECGSFEGLDERYFRVAVRLPHQNERLLYALKKWIAVHSGTPAQLT
jgi:threonine-phosphate decarboxylase